MRILLKRLWLPLAALVMVAMFATSGCVRVYEEDGKTKVRPGSVRITRNAPETQPQPYENSDVRPSE